MFTPDKIQNIPSTAWVYIFKDERGKILYIGKAKNLKKRVSQYFSPGSLRKQEMVSKAENLDFHSVNNESEALYLEDNLIKKHQPYYNNLLKADNSYAYIKITNEVYPQIILVRKKINDGSTYIGPKHNTQNLKKFLQYIRQVLQYRGCKSTQFKQGKVCSDYYFGLCKGRCVKTAGKQAHTGNTKDSVETHWMRLNGANQKWPMWNTDEMKINEYKNIMKTVISFFKGDTKDIKNEVKKQIQKAILKQHFERAAKLRDIFTEIDAMTEQQTVVVQEKIQGYVIHVKQVGQWWIYILLYFYEGKLIDIIRHKEHINDKEEDEIVFDLNREFGTLYPQSAPKNELIISTIKKLKKSSQKELQILTQQLFQSYLINSSFDESNLINELLKTLQTRYELKNFPYRIECIDISHLSGGRSSGGLSCLLGGIKYPHGYRRYKMQTPGGDDYLALQELIIRRFEHMDAENNLPSCLVIDGGKGQLNIIKKIYQNELNMRPILDKIDIISLGKGEARNKTKIWSTSRKGVIQEKIYRLKENLQMTVKEITYDEADKLLLMARDEAHRFANAYRKKQMSKEFKT